MSKLSIGPPPALPLERKLESQLEDVPMVDVVEQRIERPRWKQIERTEGGMMEGLQSQSAKNCKTAKRNKQRKKKRQSQAKQKWNDSRNQSH